MKKTLTSLLLVLLIALMTVGSVSAQKNKINLKGEVISFDGSVLVVESNKGETVEVVIPEGFELPELVPGDTVVVKADAGEGGEWIAESVKLVGHQNTEENQETYEYRFTNAYCVDGKKETNHPLAAKIAERYGIDEETMMTYYCQGYSIGEIMLALKTSQMEGVEASFEDILAGLDGPDAWGQIWQDMGLIGWEKNETPPPGQLKKMEADGDD
ncbi:MAG: hypothetical protein H0S79_16580 [Anaerolineaceae bacterium]|nr:hypothetical protein [Anaerolineaceae bacterium]